MTKKSTPESNGDNDNDDDDVGVGLAIDDVIGGVGGDDDDCSDWERRAMQSLPNKPGTRRALE